MNRVALAVVKLQLILTALLICILPGYAYAEKMRIGFSEEIDSTIEIPDFLKTNLKDSIRQFLVNSGKFEVVERDKTEIKHLLDEMYSSSERVGRVDINDDKKAEFGRIAGIEYMVFITINDFFAGIEQSRFERIKTSGKSAVRISANLRLVNTSTAKIKLEKNISAKKYNANYEVQEGDVDREAANKAIKTLSDKITMNIVDELYPILILDRSGDSAFINRGKDNGIKAGNILEVFAIKQVLDKGTQEEVELAYPIGKIKITSVFDKTSQAEIMEDFGISKGSIAKDINIGASEADKVSKDEKIKEEDW